MQINSELCHVDENKIIVRITVSENQMLVSSALGQGKDVNEAENNALSKAMGRVNLSESELDLNNNTSNKQTEAIDKYPLINSENTEVSKDRSIDLPTYKSTNNQTIDSPKDWSEEIYAIDYEIKRIGWSKEEEDLFINESLECRSRDRITTYDDIMLFISLLKKTKEGSTSKDFKGLFNSENLILQSNKLLDILGWETVKARDFLNKKFNKNSRNLLTKKEHLKFIHLLEQELDHRN